MIKDYGYSERQLLQQNLKPVDWIAGPWSSIEEFEENLNARQIPLTDIPDGTKIRVVSGNSFKEYYKINNTWNEIKEDIEVNGDSLNDGYKINIGEKSVTIPSASNMSSGVFTPCMINALDEMSNVVQQNNSDITLIKNKNTDLDNKTKTNASNIERIDNVVTNQGIDLANATFSEEDIEDFAPSIEESVIECANKAATSASIATDEVIKSHAQLKEIYKTLETIKNSEDIDEAISAAIAKNAGDITSIKSILGEKLVEITCSDTFTMLEFHVTAGVSYVMDCYRKGGLEVYSMSANSTESTYIKEKLLDQSSGNRFVKFTPTKDAEYLRIYMHDKTQGDRIIAIYPLGISQRLDEIDKSIENIDDTREKVLEVMDKVGGHLVSFDALHDKFTTVECNIKKGGLYKIECSRSGSVQIITKTVSTTISSSDNHVVDNIQLSATQKIYFTASNDASYVQVYTLSYDQNINISVDNFKEGNVFKGKKCVWLGTSIPAGAIPGDNRVEAYPIIVGDILGMQVVNKSLSSSNIAIKNNASTITDKSAMLCLSMTKAEMQNMWSDKADTSVTNASFEEIFKVITPNTDIVVIDHGFNDRLRCHEDVIAGYDNIDFTSVDKHSWHGAFKFLLDKIYYINPRIKVIIAGYFSNRHTVDTTAGDINTNDVCIAQEYLAKAYNLQILRVWNILGVNDKPVDVSPEYLSEYNEVNGKNATSLTRFTLFCPDGVHPHTDKTGKSLKDYADAIVQCLNSN